MLVQELLAIAGIAVGVALVFAAVVANSSLTGSIRLLSDGLIGDADLQIAARGPDGFDSDLLQRVRGLEDVQTAAPVLETRANVIGPSGRRPILLIGGDLQFIELGERLFPNFADRNLYRLQALALPTPLAVDLGVSLGQAMRLEVHGRAFDVPLTTQLQERDVGQLVDNPVALAPLPFVQRVTGLQDRVSRIFVRTRADRRDAVEERVRELVGGRLNIEPADAEVTAFEQAAYPTSQATMLFSALSALVGFLFAFSAVLLTVPQRRRLANDMRMAGHEGWVLVQLLLFDAVVLGAFASVFGVLLGDQLSRHLFETTPGYLSAAFPVGSQRIVTWQSVAIAVGSGLVAAALAVLIPLWRIVMAHPLAAGNVRGIRGHVWGVLAGVAGLSLTTVVIVAAPDVALLGLVSLTAALLCFLPSLLAVAAWILRHVTRGAHTPVPTLAMVELRARDMQPQALALAATGALAVFAIVSIGGARTDLERGLHNSARAMNASADVWITLVGSSNTLATTSFEAPRATTKAIRGLPGVENLRIYRGGFLDVGSYRAWVIAPPRETVSPLSAAQVAQGNAERANRRLRQGGWVVVSEAIAEEMDAEVGDRVELPFPARRSLTVAAISNNLGWPSGAVVLNADDYASAWDTRAISALHVDLSAGARPGRVKRAIEAQIGPKLPLQVETAEERIERHYATADDGLARLTQISWLVVIAAVLAMAVTMAGMIWQRRSTFAYLKVSGFSQRDLWTALMLEGGVLLGTGCVAGAVFGLYGQALLSRALAAITGFPVSYALAAPTAFATLALIVALVFGMLALPGWLAVRVRPSPTASG